ncbi:hypothetical protein [Pandoraea eparura]|uniref:hypothetical protein n=1 Tax=Pandoraea eparura TaxID=2508291 RepID=UPI0031B5A984
MTQRNLLRSGGQSKGLGRRRHLQRLVRLSMVVELDPVADHTVGVLQRFEAVTMYALLLERANHALDHTVLLWSVWRDEFLAQSVTAYQGRVGSTREDNPVVASTSPPMARPESSV